MRAILVHIDFRRRAAAERNEEFDEFALLAASAGAEPVATVRVSRAAPDARYCIGSGKVEELARAAQERRAELLLFNHALSPAQERNIERVARCRVLDRVGLILDIFARRAHTHEGKLQVELAQLQHLSTRLVRGWSHLERQKGGIGLRGPGETQLETDRRLLGGRIKTIHRRLARVRSQRRQSRRRRKNSRIPRLSLVGYTNAGKSSLFNRLSGAGVYTADKLFATLDPTVRRVELDRQTPVLLSDTVGFIRHIPHDLIAAFHATLDEAREADLLLHVIDSGADSRLRVAEVNQVIAELGAGDIPQVLVYNKIDASAEGDGVASAPAAGQGHETGQAPAATDAPRLDGSPPAARVSAKTGAGLAALKQLLAARLRQDPYAVAPGGHRARELKLPATAGRLRAGLFRHGRVTAERAAANGGWHMRVEAPPEALARLCRENGVEVGQLL